MGGVIRDIALHFTESFSLAYAILFIGEAVGLYFCIILLMRVDVKGFAKQRLMDSSSPDLITVPPQKS